jgi:CheY-like chemotaxis protein
MAARNIYIIEDDPFYGRLYSLLLSSHASMHIAVSAEDVDWSLAETADVLILDMMLPGKDGLELLGTLASKSFQGEIVVVSSLTLSGIADMWQKVLDMNLNIRSILTKPFTATTLLKAAAAVSSPERPYFFNRHSLHLLEAAIRRDSFVIDYKPFFSLASGKTEYIEVRPHLIDVDGAVDETGFGALLQDPDFNLQYFDYLCNKVSIESAFLPFGSSMGFLVALHSPSNLEETHIEAVAKRIEMLKARDTRIIIGISDEDYFPHSTKVNRVLDMLERISCRAVLLDASYSLNSEVADLTLFSEIRTDIGRSAAGTLGARPDQLRRSLMKARSNGMSISTSGHKATLRSSELAPLVDVSDQLPAFMPQLH